VTSRKPRSRWPGVELPEGLLSCAPPNENKAGGKFASVNKARAKAKPGALNGVEKARARSLELLRQAGLIQGWFAHPWSLRLGKRSRYEFDFLVIDLDGTLVCEEVKGQARWSLDDESRTKFKIAAEIHPYLRFRGVYPSEDGWKTEEHTPLAPWPPLGGSRGSPPCLGEKSE